MTLLISGQLTGHVNLYSALIQAAVGDDGTGSRHASDIRITDGGSGYAVNDEITLATATITAVTAVGTGTPLRAKLLVTGVDGSGAVTLAEIINTGVYSTAAGEYTESAFSTTGSGTGLECDITLTETGWTSVARTITPSTWTIVNGGTGHSPGDVLTILGGVPNRHEGSTEASNQTQLTVLTVSGGAVTSVSVTQAGSYQQFDTTGTYATSSSGSGRGATFQLATYTTNFDTGGVHVLQGQSGDSAISAPTVGFHKYTRSSQYNVACFSVKDFDDTVRLDEQATITAGYHGAADGSFTSATTAGSYMYMNTSAASNFWISITPRSIAWVFQAGSTYQSMYAGLIDQFTTPTQNDYPMYLTASANQLSGTYAQAFPLVGGIGLPVHATGGAAFPPSWIYDGSGFVGVSNAQASTSSATTTTGTVSNDLAGIWPTFGTRLSGDESIFDDYSFGNYDLVGSGAWTLQGALDGSSVFLPLPIMVMRSSPTVHGVQTVYGQLRDAFWVQNKGALAVGDVIKMGGKQYTVFQSGSITDNWTYFMVRTR